MRDDPRPTTEPLSFARWLADMSRALGYPREADLARALGLPQSTVSRWRKGSRPSVEHLVRLSRVLKTELEPLLVLSGHVDADIGIDVLSRPPEPPSSRTETVRRIEEADLPEDMKEILRQYWDRRLAEERGRVYRFITQFSSPEDVAMEEMKGWLASAYETELPLHVTSAFLDLLSAQVDQEGSYPSPERRHLLRIVGELYERSMTPDEIGELLDEPADVVDALIIEAQALAAGRRR
ncbi:transcriptional regulator [Actinomadura sp. KC345]|uniref:transcriptional regulator n=1 Tax=Actinomadura sp. KC345 TaxID=2530371 RepID=UPI0010514B60|nr:transcriptional regulator [Actinomadura sp. KC345]TDC52865.1 transcriptional regulator [Actinomadura sp. KC345]